MSPSSGNCSQILSNTASHRVDFSYNDLSQDGHFSTWSLRFGAPVSFTSLLKQITVTAKGFEQHRFLLDHEGTSTETRRPRLIRIRQLVPKPGNTFSERTLRFFAYGNRQAQFDTEVLLDLGPLGTFPPSLVGAVSRPIRQPYLLNNPNGILQLGNDQVDETAPYTSATTEQWSWMDLNGDGLLDFHWARETGQDPSVPRWPTFEPCSHTACIGETPPSPRPPQQVVRISEGIVDSHLVTTPIVMDSHALAVEQAYPRDGVATSGSLRSGVSNWIWAEGRGITRTGMPVSVSAPEIRNIAPTCPTAPGQDSRLWPVYPDGTLGGSQGSAGETASALAPFNLSVPEYLNRALLDYVPAIRNAYQPSYSVSSTLSGWIDLNGDGVPDFVATPGWIERFNLNPLCGGGREPNPASNSTGVDHDWHAAPLPPMTAGTVSTLRLQPVPGPPGPTGIPIDYSISTGSPEGFGFTLPIGSFISAGVSSVLSENAASLAVAIPSLIAESFSPRSQTGSSLSMPSPSAIGVLQGLANVNRYRDSASTYGFASSILKINYDLTLLSTTTRNRSEIRAQLLDINADGLPDYLLYNSGNEITGVPKGTLLAFLNSPNGFGGPVIINEGFDYQQNLPDLATLASAANNAKIHAAVLGVWSEACTTAANVPVAGYPAAVAANCGPFLAALQSLVSTANSALKASGPFIRSTTDTIPAEKFHLSEVATLKDYLQAGVVAGSASLLTSLPAEASALNTVAQAVETSIRMLERTARQLGYRSRLNAITRGFSELDGSAITDSARGIAVQTRGFVDLNGDGLPDYIITSDREKSCPDGAWEVFWGTGTSSISARRAFLPTPTCLQVPAPPDDVKSRGFTTLPLNVDRIRRAATSNAQVVDTLSHSYISLFDFNHDGRPDLVMAGEGRTNWDPDATSRTWSVFLNTGTDFEATASLRISSPQTSRTDIQPASSFATGLNVPYPVVRTTHTDASFSLVRDRTDTHAGLLAIDGAGVGEMVTRVKFTAADLTEHDGMFVWRRSSTGPQDRMVEDRDAVGGRRILIEYKPASHFQWTNASPDGQPPKEGHRALAGTSGHLVRSVTAEPLIGRAEQRTRVGYEYGRPFFDINTRLPGGFAIRTSSPLNPETGAAIGASVVTLQRNAQRPDGVNSLTHIRQLIRATRAPIHETLVSYVEQSATPGNPGPLHAVFAAPVRRLSVEYPEGLTAGAIFDIGFDGRDPLLDRANALKTTSTILPTLSPGSATGGGAVFNPATPTALQYPSPHLPSGISNAPITAIAIETWAKPTSGGAERTVIDQPGAYRLSIVQVSAEDRVQIEITGTKITATSALLSGRWAHIVATFGSGNAKLFVNGVEVGSAGITGTPIASGDLIIGCAQAPVGFDRCFNGELGELRIYPEAWPHAPRVSDSETVLQLDPTKDDFGQPLRVLERQDLATPDDDVVTEYTYASPIGPKRILGAVSTKTQRVLAPDGVTAGNYLGYAEYAYDARPVGQVAAGNPSSIAQFDGAPEVQVKPSQLDVVTRVEYSNTSCPGKPTKTVDAEGFATLTEWDGTCTFVLSARNALGHTTVNHYYGVDGFSLPASSGPYGAFRRTGKFGQVAEGVDSNGAVTTFGYDEWGRQLVKWEPLDRDDRPSQKHQYVDAQCQVSPGISASCADPATVDVASPPRITDYTWDDQLDRCKTSRGDQVSCAEPDAFEMAGDGAIGAYRGTHTFGDGQVDAQTIRDGKPAWIVSGVKDFDVQGRAIRSYKERYLPVTGSGTIDPCPLAGQWCDSVRLKGNPLRDGVATVQTAYDARGRVIRIYGPGVPSCGSDPSILGTSGQPACDSRVPQGVLGHVTRMEYPGPGVTRVTNARGVPAVSRTDVRGLTTAVEEYDQTISTPYAFVRSTYDRLTRLVQTSDHQNNASTTVYDALGRVTKTTDPDMGDTSFTYDRRGLLTKQIVANGDIARHLYDPLRRLTYSEYRPSKLENLRVEIDQCRHPTRPCDLPPLGIDLSRWVDIGDFFSQFRPVPPRTPLSGTRLTELRPEIGDLDSGVAALSLPFDVMLTPNAIWTESDTARRRVRIIPGTNLFHAGSRIYINTNGKIRFDAGGAKDHKPATDGLFPTQSPEIALYPFFSDLTLKDGGLRSTVTGDSPNRELVIQWSGALRAQPDQPVEFRTIISEVNSEVRYEYDVVPAGARPIVGAKNHSLKSDRAVVVRALSENGEPFVPASRTAVSSHQIGQEKRFVLEPLIKAGVPQPSTLQFTVPLAERGEFSLSFRHRWFSRCALVAAGACQVDRMTVGYLDPENPSIIRILIPADRLTSNASLDQAASERTDEIINVALPKSLAGQKVTFVFQYDPVTISAINQKVQWMIDHLNILGAALGQSTTRVEGEVEEKVWREHDSAESAHTTIDPSLLTDLTFDVPGRIDDRSSLDSVNLATLPPNVESILGASGKGLLLKGQGIELDLKNSALPGLTIEAWVQPGSYPLTTIQILGADNVFSLTLMPDGRVGCSLSLSNILGVGYAASTSILPIDAWTHIALSYDRTTLRCFINGAVEVQSAVSGTLNTAVLARIGDSSSNDHIALDEVRFYARDLGPDRILQDALRPLQPGPPGGNVIDIRFGDPIGRELDASRAGNNAILTGGRIIPGVQGAAFEPNGGEVTVPHNQTLTFVDAVTTELWLKTKSPAVVPTQLIGKWPGTGPGGWRLGLERFTGRLRWEVLTKVTGPTGTTTAHAVFVTWETIDDDRWHHVAATYDGRRLRVFIDGRPAHRTCSVEGSANLCVDLPPPDTCAIETFMPPDYPGNPRIGDAICSNGSIDNTDPVRAGTDFNGVIDELRVSNYAKREFEIAASSRMASAYTQVLGREIDLRNELPVGTQVARELRAYDMRGSVVSMRKRIIGQSASDDFLSRQIADTLGRVGAQEYPDGEVVVNRFDHTGLQTGLTGFGPFIEGRGRGRQDYLTDASATVTGRVEHMMYGNDVATSYSYDDGPTGNGGFGSDWLAGQTISKTSNTALSQRSYGWNVVGNLETATDTAEQYSANYGYDDLNRVTSADFQVGGSSQSRSYGYNSIGNLTLKDGVAQDYGRASSPAGCGTGATTLPHAITKRTTGLTVDPLCYDEIGRLVRVTDITHNNIRNHSYYARGKLSKLSDRNGEYDFRYDGNGTRVAKNDSIKNIFDPYAFYRETANGAESIYSANGQLIARRTSPQQTDLFWYHPDHLGGTNLMTDFTGNEDRSARSHYLPFGEFLTAPNQIINRSGGRQFTDKELDNTGYYDYGDRYYDPLIGRFIEPDSVVPGLGTQATNRYSYALNNPIYYIDPTGHRPELHDLSIPSGANAHCSSCTLFFDDKHAYDSMSLGEVWSLPDREARQAFMTGGIAPIQLSIPNIEMRETYNALVPGIALIASMGTSAFAGMTPSFLGVAGKSMWVNSIAPGARTFATSISTEAILYEEAAQIHILLDSVAMGQRTTSVVRAMNAERKLVDIFASGAQADLTPLQRAAVLERGGITARLPGAHAEGTALSHIANQPGWYPLTGNSFPRNICPSCRLDIEISGGRLINSRNFSYMYPNPWTPMR